MAVGTNYAGQQLFSSGSNELHTTQVETRQANFTSRQLISSGSAVVRQVNSAMHIGGTTIAYVPSAPTIYLYRATQNGSYVYSVGSPPANPDAGTVVIIGVASSG